MSAAKLMADLTRLRIRLEVHGDRLRYSPRTAVTPELANRMKAHKGELLAMLRLPIDSPTAFAAVVDSDIPKLSDEIIEWALTVWEKPRRLPAVSRDAAAIAATRICRCGSTTWCDVKIHGGQSVRRDCGRCGRLIKFPVWYGKDTGQIGQYRG